MKKKLFSKLKNKADLVAIGTVCLTTLSTIPAFAEGTDISTVTGSVTSAINASKSDFVTAIGAVVAVGVSWFLVKYVVMQVITYFKKVASK